MASFLGWVRPSGYVDFVVLSESHVGLPRLIRL